MGMDDIIRRVEPHVKEILASNDASHDWLHIERVRKNALDIAAKLLSTSNGASWLTVPLDREMFIVNAHNSCIDLAVIELAALLHDVGDFKYSGTDAAVHDAAKHILETVQCPADMIARTLAIVDNVSYRKEMGTPGYFHELLACQTREKNSMVVELAIVQDADRIDAIGAVGVVRCFSYSAARGQPFYEMGCVPNMGMNRAEYDKQTISNKGNPVHHFYEKLFQIKDKMKTVAGMDIAQERHEFMVQFVRRFEQEVGLPSYDCARTDSARGEE